MSCKRPLGVFFKEKHLKCPYGEFVNPMLLQMPRKFLLKQTLPKVHMFHQNQHRVFEKNP